MNLRALKSPQISQCDGLNNETRNSYIFLGECRKRNGEANPRGLYIEFDGKKKS